MEDRAYFNLFYCIFQNVLGGAVVGVISGYIGYKVTLRMSRHSGMN